MARDNAYSRAVVWIKVTLPLIALALLSSLFLLSGTPDPEDALPYADVDIDEITREQRVTQPRFAGLLEDGRELVLVAEAVAADTAANALIRARAVDGRLDLAEGDRLHLRSALAEFDMARQMAILQDGVELRSDLGYRVESEVLHMAMDRLHLRSPGPVRVRGPGLDLTADAMEMGGPEGATILRFTGAVRMLYDPQQ